MRNRIPQEQSAGQSCNEDGQHSKLRFGFSALAAQGFRHADAKCRTAEEDHPTWALPFLKPQRTPLAAQALDPRALCYYDAGLA